MEMKTVEAQLERAKKLAAELLAQLDVLDGAIRGEKTPGQNINRLFKSWGELWTARYHSAYVTTNRAKVAAQCKKLLGSLTVEDIEARMAQYLASNDRFYTQAKHSLDLFLVSINKFSGSGPSDDDGFMAAPPPDCRHTPACKTDAEHTQRRARDLRTDAF